MRGELLVASRKRRVKKNITQDYVRTRSDEAALASGCYLDVDAAERVRKFFREFLRHSKGKWAGQQFELLDWQWTDIVLPLFGWKRADGTRRFRRAYIEIPKKNGKSTLAAAIGLYMLVADGEAGAEVYSLGFDREQASIVHNEAIQMVKASAELSSILRINAATRTIHFDATNSRYAALSSDAHGIEGINAHCLIADELHVWKDSKLWNAIQYAGRARRQPLLFVITTAGDDNSVLCREVHEYAVGVLNNSIVDERFFAYIRAAEPGDDWTAEETWRKANPSLGITISLDDFRADFHEATRTPRATAAFMRYSLNIWISAETAWIDAVAWDRCKATYSEQDLEGEECWLGLDLAKTTSLAAATLVFPRLGAFYTLAYAWLPQRYLSLADCRDEVRAFAAQGLITVTPGDVVDYERVYADIAQMCERFRIVEVVFDPWNAEFFTQRIELDLNVPRIEFRQTIRNFAAVCREFERLVLCQQIKHNNPFLSWQIKHTTVKQDASGNMRPVKPQGPRSGQFIDNVVSLLMALARAQQVVTERDSTSQQTPIEFI
ncbi:MAG: terminase TerL endonuclease subunit [Candidatus Caldarchaeum sp.]